MWSCPVTAAPDSILTTHYPTEKNTHINTHILKSEDTRTKLYTIPIQKHIRSLWEVAKKTFGLSYNAPPLQTERYYIIVL